jgi:hypothetical protein
MPTEEMAKEAERAMTPNPQQRAMFRYAARASRSKSAATVRSENQSSGAAGHSTPTKSPKPTSPKSVTILQPRPKH